MKIQQQCFFGVLPAIVNFFLNLLLYEHLLKVLITSLDIFSTLF